MKSGPLKHKTTAKHFFASMKDFGHLVDQSANLLWFFVCFSHLPPRFRQRLPASPHLFCFRRLPRTFRRPPCRRKLDSSENKNLFGRPPCLVANDVLRCGIALLHVHQCAASEGLAPHQLEGRRRELGVDLRGHLFHLGGRGGYSGGSCQETPWILLGCLGFLGFFFYGFP